MTINSIKNILGKDNVRRFYYLIPLDITASLLELLSISIIIPFVVAVSDKERVLASEYAPFINDQFESYNDFLFALVVTLILVSFASMLLSVFANARKISLANRIGQTVGQSQYKKYLYAEYGFHSNINKSELSKNLMAEISRFTNNVLIAIVTMISKGFFLIVALGFMMNVNASVSITIIFSVVGLYFLVYKGFRGRLISNGQHISKSMTNLYSYIAESLNGIQETKFYQLEKYYFEKYIGDSDTIAKKTASSQIISIIPKSVIEFIIFATLATILIYLYSNGKLTENLPVITFFLYAGYRTFPAVQQIYNSSVLIRANYESVNRILKFDHLIKDDDEFERLMVGADVRSIAVKRLGFGYGNHKRLFKDFSLEIFTPSFVAIIGESGSGKSTLIDLVLKLNRPDSGEVVINNREYSFGDARSVFAYVPQNIHLADSTLLLNIVLGDINKPVDYELIESSFKLAGLGGLVRDLPEGINTEIGENGSALSGGQRKRLGLARAFYSQKPVLILDEVTSGLDSDTESKILCDLKLISKNRLIILVTHNLQNIDIFDQVVNLDLKNHV
ncbi:ABC transporter ATP-binding protein/permease [bacterium]|nr:ABC transporter ATP-binding protein/permease [bacterium]